MRESENRPDGETVFSGQAGIEMDPSDVIVVGAGIGGAVLALALGSRGWRVTVLEREPRPLIMARPEILWSPTPAALDRFGVGEPIRTQASVKLAAIAVMHRSRRLAGFTPYNLRASGIDAFSADPGHTRRLIAEAALATGHVEIRRGVEVRNLVREGDRIAGVEAIQDGQSLELRARLIVGDDGAHSIVRSAMLPDLKLDMFPFDFITAAIDWPAEIPPDQARLWMNPRAFHGGIPAVACLPWPNGRGVLLMPLPHVRATGLFAGTPAAFWAQFPETTPLAGVFSSRLRFPDDFHAVRRPYGHASKYVTAGAAILGDAAHPVSPAGGQGANAAIWDAMTLADIAHDALTRGDLSAARLSRYETFRRPRNRDSVSITERAAGFLRIASGVPGLRWLVPAALRTLDCLPFVKSRILRTFASLFVTTEG